MIVRGRHLEARMADRLIQTQVAHTILPAPIGMRMAETDHGRTTTERDLLTTTVGEEGVAVQRWTTVRISADSRVSS